MRLLNAIAAFLFVASFALASPTPNALPWAESGKVGAVVSEDQKCSNIGISLIEDGGSAADAIIGTILCVGTINTYHSGIGGGGFALIFENGNYTHLDFRETAPSKSNNTMFIDSDRNSTIGGLAVGVPGEIRALEYIHNKWGRLPWSRPFEKAAELARDGFIIEQDLSKKLKSSDSSYGFLREDPIWSSMYTKNGTVLSLGDKFVDPILAETYQIIGKNGPDSFYTGEIAENIVEAVQNSGGIITLDDLKNYSIKERPVLSIDFGENHKIYSTSAPSSGAAILNALNSIKQFDDNVWSNSNYTAQVLAESFKFGYATRGNLADPDFIKNVTEIEASSITNEVGEFDNQKISLNSSHSAEYYSENPVIAEDHGTSQIIATDTTGLTITLTTSINLYFGSHVATKNHIILNNNMDDFSTPEQSNSFGYVANSINYPEPGKRPQSSISPGIIEKDGKVFLAFGSAGGSHIITANIQTVINYIKKGFSAQSSISHPRLHGQTVSNLNLEYAGDLTAGYSNTTAAYLESSGQNVTFVAPGSSSACAIGISEDGSFDIGFERRLYNAGGMYV